MSSDGTNSQIFRSRELRSRLVPRQQIHNHPLTKGSTFGIKRPFTRQSHRKVAIIETKPKLPFITSPRVNQDPDVKKSNESTQETELESIRDPFEFIEYAKKRNLTSEFVYLYPSDIIEDAEHPTRLVIIPASQASREEFWNLSLKGLTHVKGSAVDFIPLDEWMNSLNLFSKLLKIPFFKYQRQWRMFKIWKSQVKNEKMSFAKSALSSELFYAHGILRPAFLKIQRELHELKQLKLFSVRSDGMYTLEQFIEENNKRRDVVAKHFEEFFLKIEKIIQDSCEKTLDSLNSPDNVVSSSPLEQLIANYKHSIQNAHDGTPSSLQFTQKAAHRAACSKLLRFVRLIDYFIISALRHICFVSLIDFYCILQSLHIRGLTKFQYTPKKPIEELNIPLEYKRIYSIIFSKIPDVYEAPIFNINISYDQHIVLNPSSDEILRKIDTIRNDFIDVLFKIPRFVADPVFRPYLYGEASIDKFSVDQMSSPDLGQIIFNDIVYKETVKKQNEIILAAFKLTKFYSKTFNKAIDIYKTNESFDLSFMNSEDIMAKDISDVIDELSDQEAYINTITEKSDIGIFCCFAAALKQKLLISPKVCLNQIKQYIPSVIKRLLEKFNRHVNGAYSELHEKKEDVQSFVNFINACHRHSELSEQLQKECDVIRDFYTLANQHDIFISNDEYTSLLPLHDGIKIALRNSPNQIAVNMTRFTKMLEESISNLNQDAKIVMEMSNNPKLSTIQTEPKEAANILVVLIARTDELRISAQNYNIYQDAMEINKTKFDDIKALVKKVDLIHLMWETYTQWESSTSRWFSVNFNEIDTTLMIDQVKTYKNNATEAFKGLPGNAAANNLYETISDFSKLLPVVENLKNPALQKTHKDQIESLIGTSIFNKEDFTFKELFDLHAYDFAEQINSISTHATNEQALTQKLAEVKDTVEKLHFTVSPFRGIKNTYNITGMDEMIATLEDAMTTVSSVRSSRYIAKLRKESDDWAKSLRQFIHCIGAIEQCQRNWSYLVSILSNSEISRVLSDDVKEMGSVDKTWRSISTRINDDPTAYPICNLNQTVVDLDTANETLEKIRRDIEKHLESKRIAYPRLYFLSNTELMTLISKSKDSNAILPFLPRIFDGIVNVEFGVENQIPCITSVLNNENEKLSVRPIKYRSNIEGLFSSIEEIVQKSLKNEIKNARATFQEMVREDWLISNNTQVASIIANIEFNEKVKFALSSINPSNSLSILLNEIELNISTSSNLARLDLTILERLKIQNLLAIDLLNRDILSHIINSEIYSLDDYFWLMQMRYSWDELNKNVIVEHGFGTYHYGFEFLNTVQRIIITPKISLSLLAITNSLFVKSGAAVFGSHCSGKTETVKDLSRALGYFCFCFNCSESILANQLSALLRGIIQSGVWILFSDLHRVKPEVLSIIGEDFQAIKQASLANLKKFEMDGFEIQLNQQSGIFMTTTPINFEKIPDSTKNYFRPISLNPLEEEKIVEIHLIILGFINTKIISKKIVLLIRAMNDHFLRKNLYSFDFNTIKSILSLIIPLKHPNDIQENEAREIEENIILTSIKRTCIKSLDFHDINDFNQLITNYFPNASTDDIIEPVFSDEIIKSCKEIGLIASPNVIKKSKQLHESLGLHTGIIVIGDTCVGKSSLLSILETTYNRLSEKADQYYPIQKHIICPKSLTIPELWGYYDNETSDWHDGVISNTFNDAQRKENKEHWIVFDGNIDPSWIENMNSALNDTKTLTFDNMLHIKLTSQYQILFETTDIVYASPAIISRCAVIYVDNNYLSWNNFIDSAIEKKIAPMFIGHHDLIDSFKHLINISIESAIELVKENINSMMQISIFGLIQSFLDLFILLCSSEEFKIEYSDKAMTSIFVFAFAWGFGGFMDNTHRLNVDSFIRDVFANSLSLPPRDTIYEWSVDAKSGEWKHWNEYVQSFSLVADDEFEIDPENIRFYNALVPTIETVRLSYIIEKMLLSNHHIIIRGMIGSGRRLLVRSILRKLQENNQSICNSLMFSVSTNSKTIHKMFKLSFEIKKKNKIIQPHGGALSVLYVQDINKPMLDETNSCISIEMLRQFISMHGYRPSPTLEWLNVKNISLLGVGLPDGGGGSSIPSRLSRHALNLELPTPDSSTSYLIIRSIWQLFFRTFDDNINEIIPKLASVTINLYETILQTFPPSRTAPLYRFSMNDLMRLTESLLCSRIETITTPQQMERLWVHEIFRVFADRIESEDEYRKFEEIMTNILKKKLGSDQSISRILSSYFGTINSDHSSEKLYQEFKETSEVTKILQKLADDYFIAKRGNIEKITIFDHFAKHVMRILRVLNKKRGHMMLIGKYGIGKKSAIEFACFISECELYNIGYSLNRDDIKSIISRCGINGKEIAFIFDFSQLMQYSELADTVNSLINSMDMSFLFTRDELDKICNDLVMYARSIGENESYKNLLRLFHDRVSDHLHIFLYSSLETSSLSKFLLQYPSFLANVNVDYFEEWKESAFIQYAFEKFSAEKKIDDDDDFPDKFSKLSYFVYQKVSQMSQKMEKELRIKYPVSPVLFMNFISFFKDHFENMKSNQREKIVKFFIGLDKMNKLENIALQIQENLKTNEEILHNKEEHGISLSKEIFNQVNATNLLHDEIKNDQADTEKQITESDNIAKDKEREFSEVKPALEDAIAGMKALKRTDLNEIKGLLEPPLPIKIVMEILCILCNIETSWKSSVNLLNDPLFISKIVNKYNEDNHIPPIILSKITDIIQNDDNFEKAASGEFSLAAKTICLWEKALIDYETIFRRFEPQQNQLHLFSSSIRLAKDKVKANMDKIKFIQESVDSLKTEKEQTEREILQVHEIVDEAKSKLLRYQIIDDLLQDNKEKWSTEIQNMKDSTQYLLGDSFLNSMYFIFLGPFPPNFRSNILKAVKEQCYTMNVTITPDYSFTSSLIDQALIDKWIQCGLAEDTTSLENAIMILQSPSVPYIIDPYSYAIKWLKKYEQIDHQLVILKPKSNNLMRHIENYVRAGASVLIEDIGETLDPSYNALLLKKYFIIDGKKYVKFGDRNIEIDEKFRLFLSTTLHNPDISSEFFIKTNVINFVPTQEMIEKTQVYNIFNTEFSVLNKKRKDIQQKIVSDNKLLQQSENRIIELLRTNENSILEEDAIVQTLKKTKERCNKLQKIIQKCKYDNEIIKQIIKIFTPVANRVGLIFTVSHKLSHISYMYSYSFELFGRITRYAIKNSPRNDTINLLGKQVEDVANNTDTGETSYDPKTSIKIIKGIVETNKDAIGARITELINNVTFNLFSVISDSLYRRHRLLFTFLLACHIMLDDKTLPEDQYWLLVLGNEPTDSPFENPLPELISKNAWNELHTISRKVSNIRSLPSKIISDAESFKVFMNDTSSHLPQQFFGHLSDFEQILVIKTILPSRLALFVAAFISKIMGPQYINMSSFSLDHSLSMTKVHTPILFLMNKNIDVRSYLNELAVNHNMSSKFVTFSCGQGLLHDVESLIHSSISRGEWLLIQNIHLSESMCNDIDSTLLKISKNTAHPEFRLFLTTYSSNQIPISIIRKSIKKSLEQYFSIQSCMLSITNSIDNSLFNHGLHTHLLFMAAFLHSMLNVRKKYGSLGFHQSYTFSTNTFKLIVGTVKRFLNVELDLQAYRWILSKISYGGGIFDPWDKRCFESFVELLVNEETLQSGVEIMGNSNYITPKSDSKADWLDAIMAFPEEDSPEIFGLAPKCQLILTNNRSNDFLQFLKRLIFSRVIYPSVDEILEKIHDLFSKIPTLEDTPNEDGDSNDPLGNILINEVSFYQHLISIVKETLQRCELSLKMQIANTQEAEMLIEKIVENDVPEQWKLIPGQHIIQHWMNDLIKKVDFFNEWIRRGKPLFYNLPSFSNPQAFLYSLYQKYSNEHNTTVDNLDIYISFEENEPTENTNFSFIIGGLICNGMVWNSHDNEFIKSTSSSTSKCPFLRIRVVPTDEKENNEEEKMYYRCPVYKIMSNRQTIPGKVNYVTAFNLPMTGSDQTWIVDGAALFLSIDID